MDLEAKMLTFKSRSTLSFTENMVKNDVYQPYTKLCIWFLINIIIIPISLKVDI